MGFVDIGMYGETGYHKMLKTAKTWNAKKHGIFDALLNAIVLAQIQAVFDTYIEKEAIWASIITCLMQK